jgi:predicted ATP-grasp superfamily ATP-dependent carboligase
METGIQSVKKPYAVVFALDSVNGLQTARTLAKRAIPVIGIAGDLKHPCSRTRLCEEIIVANTETDDVIKALEALGPRLAQKAVLFPCNNLEVQLISRYRQRLERWYHIVLSEQDVNEILMQKTSFYNYAQKEGFPIPRTFILNSKTDAEQAAQQLIFPCILKPSSRSYEWEHNSTFKVYKAFTADEFLALYDRCKKWSKDLVVQEWIEGPDSNLYTCYCYFSRDCEPLVTFVTRKIRQWPPEMGEGCLGEECRNDIVLEETVRLFKRIRLRGLGYLEIKCDSRTGKYLIVEPNVGRPTSKSALAEAGGVELVYTMYCDAVGRNLPANREQKYGNTKWIYLRHDFQSAFYYWRSGKLTLKEWWHSLRGPKVYALFSWTDPVPFWLDLIRSIRRYISPQERRKSTFRDPFPRVLPH